MVVCLHAQAKPVVQHDQVAVPTAYDCIRHYCLHLLRNDADIGLVAAIVAEPIEAKTIVEIAEQRDVMFEHDIRPPTATAPPATTAAATTHARTSPTAAAHTARPWSAGAS